ncbi:hypothetical protein SAMD00019534_058860 [Acytostelium subglobosum LB1]|uniref:hypothetical protein n=1 Tax=Acytostelium subglobosum LB1 TaxID=1410327 RepID=UPI000644C086|nr:hypothetical protein SAMD00019534_058860 [Acytostelium subglobosum LB1]GAM22711.1 hypothetical protein SAMD00019534_058860 [Acytostelium subglobosum LB1]|eukprot:XP_012753938.1 hypothetical protein SAMD00019534_058860 [Acytostelium subglobosum LB1]
MYLSPLVKQADGAVSPSWSKLQPLLENSILKKEISGVEQGLDILLSWFENITKSVDKINAFKQIVGLNPDVRKQNGLSASTSSINDLTAQKKRGLVAGGSDVESFDFSNNKRMRVSRLLCSEEFSDNKSEEENSEEEPYSFDSESPEDADYPASDGEQMEDASPYKGLRRASCNDILVGKNAGQSLLSMNQKSAVAAVVNGIAPTPKQLMIIREKMIDYTSKNPAETTPSCIQIVQQPSTKIVWKNRRLDTPFKVKLDIKAASQIANQNLSVANVVALGILTDHKGKLQIDSVENFAESFNAQGLAVFQGLKMTKGTWGKEWSLTFIVVTRPSNSYNNSMIISVSKPAPIVVKTRKNPQIRHSYSSAAGVQLGMLNSPSESSSPETSPMMGPSQPKTRMPPFAPLINKNFANLESGSSTPPAGAKKEGGRFPQDEMDSLLWAAEIKQRESSDNEPEIISGNKYSSLVLSPQNKPVSTR